MKNYKATILIIVAFLLTTVNAQDDFVQVNETAKGIYGETGEQQTEAFDNLVAFVVNNNGDGSDATPGDGICETSAGNGICTLRAAVTEANALAGNDTITFDPGVTLIQLAAGQISISSNINIIGNGANSLTIQNTAAASATSRVFNITNFTVSLSRMTLTGGNATANGGAINNTGTLTIIDCAINNNTTTLIGGGIRSTNNLTIFNTEIKNNSSTTSTSGGISFAGTNLTVTNSTISGNTSFGNGGGMNLSATASITISNSTISGNTAGAASGGLFLNRGTITNTTISGNAANGALATEGGGGMRIQAGVNSVSIISATITANTAPNTTSGARSGVWHETGTLNISNSIIAANVAQDIQRDGTGVITNGGFNLIGENTSVTTEFPAGMPNGTSYVGTDAMPLDPMLGALGNNGGATQTHALQMGSIAIDKGSAFGLTTDQRGFLRINDLTTIPNSPTGDGTDIGAYEFQSIASMAAFSVSGRVTNSSGNGVPKVTVVLSNGSGFTRTVLTGSLGYYRFDNVPANQSYLVSPSAKTNIFSSQIIVLNGNIADLNFVAQ